MRKKLKFFAAMLAAMVISLVSLIAVTGCDNPPVVTSSEALQETVANAADSVLQEYANPVFSTVEEAILYRDLAVDGQHIDSIFNSMPEITLRNVVSVCIRQHGYASKRNIVEEYLRNSKVYNNLPISESEDTRIAEPIATSSSMEDSRVNGDIISSSESTIIDTIDGKPTKVKIKTERRYAGSK